VSKQPEMKPPSRVRIGCRTLADAINLHCLRPMPANVRSGH
jgi:hypothetical protein